MHHLTRPLPERTRLTLIIAPPIWMSTCRTTDLPTSPTLVKLLLLLPPLTLGTNHLRHTFTPFSLRYPRLAAPSLNDKPLASYLHPFLTPHTHGGNTTRTITDTRTIRAV